jgi:hypothetical protein
MSWGCLWGRRWSLANHRPNDNRRRYFLVRQQVSIFICALALIEWREVRKFKPVPADTAALV